MSSTGAVVLQAPAKVNLFLEVLGKRGDGYHEIETLMLSLDLCDRLEFRANTTGGIALVCDQPGLSTGPDNLVYRAASLLKERSGTRFGAEIQLAKAIPIQAGLGGGSSDAAATLRGLNRLWNLGWSEERLARLGQEIGSDVPFFFHTPAAWCTGRGEQAKRVAVAGPLWLVLVCPPVGIATAEVYRRVRIPDKPVSGVAIRQALADGDVQAIGRLLHNRLQRPAEELCPLVAALRRQLEELHPAGCLMTGSGSALFALGRDRKDAERLANEFTAGLGQEARPRVLLVQGSS
ncbi:MAG: 4-diphosphocytidyl-2-C-methyl-D-erythritol kinase [Gemmatales bacterium]|nr:MAG: 4-diphosphocytidyl-2-C-methyl-D-erythritol kinase [Gemmatales bacterium]